MAISEKIALLGAGLYTDIPNVLTLKSIPTASELDYVGGEDFQTTMLDIIFPKAIEEDINFRNLLEIDFHWICRCLRLLNYGPYYTTNTIFCPDCDKVSRGEYEVDLRTIEVKPLPENFSNAITITKDDFIDFDGEIVLHLPTIQEMINADKDTFFADKNGDINNNLSRLCYAISSINGKTKAPIEVKNIIQNSLSAADYRILLDRASELTKYGLMSGGTTVCPKCGSKEAVYVALVDARFFRPTVGNLRTWKATRNAEKSSKPEDTASKSGERDENLSTDASAKV